MGMFDNIKCEYSLDRFDIPNIQNLEYQTKNLDNLLDNYTITEKGELICHKVEYEYVPEEERPYYGKPEWNKNKLYKLCGSYRSKPIGDYLIDYTGIINFYSNLEENRLYSINFNDGTINERDPESFGWIEFKAEFEHGILKNIECIEYYEGEKNAL